MVPNPRWTDDRIDDLARRVEEHARLLDKVTDVMVQQAAFAERLDDVGEDAKECRRLLDDLKKTQDTEKIDQRRERINDRRWLIATALTVCAIVVAALGVFLA